MSQTNKMLIEALRDALCMSRATRQDFEKARMTFIDVIRSKM